MAETFSRLTDGTYFFSETDNPNVFLFWRKDEAQLSYEEATEVFYELFEYFLKEQVKMGKLQVEELIIRMSKTLSRKRKWILSNMSIIAIGLLVAGACTKKYDGSFVGRASKYLVYALLLLIILVFNQYVKDIFLRDGKESRLYVR